jgi:hypothetical protein
MPQPSTKPLSARHLAVDIPYAIWHTLGMKPRNLKAEVARLKPDWRNLSTRERADLAASLWQPMAPWQAGRIGWARGHEARNLPMQEMRERFGTGELRDLADLFSISVRSIQRARARQQRAAGVPPRMRYRDPLGIYGMWLGRLYKLVQAMLRELPEESVREMLREVRTTSKPAMARQSRKPDK